LKEIIVDNFAGGGGASTGIELATGRSVDIAINHDPEAIKMHKANHPSTEHYCESVWDVDPVKACKGRKVGLAWFSPDCKHFSKAKGGKPKDKTIRGLAWVALRWAALVRPRVIMLENVEEFKTWGPLNRRHRPIKAKQGKTFERFINQLRNLGYQVEFGELVAADYGAPTKRKRFFMIARCDSESIAWPKPTHAPKDSEMVIQGLLKPYVAAYECIDFSLPCPSIFDTSENIMKKYGIRAVRPLAENTMKRIARGLQKFVIESDSPFIVQIGQTGFSKDRSYSIHEPLTTIVSKNEHCLITPTIIQYHSETTKNGVRGQNIDEPLLTADGSNRYGLVSAFISKNYAGESRSVASDMEEPLHTITARNVMTEVEIKLSNDIKPKEGIEEFFKKYYGKPVFGDRKGKSELAASSIIQMNHNSTGQDMNEPINTIVAGPGHFGEVRTFLTKYYGQGTGQDINQPLDTVTSNDRFGLVTIKGVNYQIVDIGLRMLEPRELYNAQGFPEDYIIDKDHKGKEYSRTEQVKRCGNAVPPPFAKALVKTNLPDLCTAERMPNMRIDDTQEQLKFA
jgi:DNA (cytosine-5)-methyltransferase 1